MHKLLILIWALLLSAACAVQAQSANDSGKSGQPEAKQQQAAPKAEKKPDGRVQTRDSFTPSEKIRADTVVAFPADI